MALQKVAGEKLYIGGVLNDKAADHVAADFTSQTWVLVDGYASRPALGDQAAEIATDLINRGRTVVQKGTRRSPAGEHRFAAIAADPGQLALKAAADSHSNYAFKLVKDDAPPSGTPTTLYFIGLVLSKTDQGGEANTASMITFNIAPNSNIVEVPADDA